MEAQWNGRKDVAATDMADFDRDEIECSIRILSRARRIDLVFAG
jgi:hypothetical protein